MKLNEWYQGGNEPFEGDRTLWLRNLPANALVLRALVTITPISQNKDKPFEETISFAVDGNALGATKVRTASFIEVDLHARRTLSGLEGGGIAGMTLQIDMGGTYVDLNDRGTMKTPSDPLSFTVAADGTLPGLSLTKFKLTPQQGVVEGDLTQVKIRSVPTNLNVRLGKLPAFWTRPGDLTTPETSPDFASVLTAFLSSAVAENGFYAIPLVIHSDTIARLDVQVQIDYVLRRSALPSYLPEATLSYGFSTLPNDHESLVQVMLPEAAQPLKEQATALVRGEFKPTRVALGPVGEIGQTQSVLVAANCTLGQPFTAETDIAVTGIDLLFTKTEANLAGLSLSIQSDTDGKPSGTILTSAEVVVGKPEPPDHTSWGSATLETPFRVEAHKHYWLVLQSQVGQAFWLAQSRPNAEVGLQCRDGNGLSWRVITAVGDPVPLQALFRLRNQPERFTIPLQLQIGRGPDAVRRRLDEFSPLGRVEFQFDFAEKLSEYLARVSPVTSISTGAIDNLLVNGDFLSPACDDATLKLFDSEDLANAKQAVYYAASRFRSIKRTVAQNTANRKAEIDRRRDLDLSVERFIVLQVGNRSPVRIDCAGADPARTAWDEIIATINQALGATARGTEIAKPSEIEGASIRWKLEAPDESDSVLKLYFWISSKMPTGWQGTLGRVLRLRHPNRSDRFVVLLADPQMLNQRLLPAPPLPDADTGIAARRPIAEGRHTPLPIFPIVSTPGAAQLDEFSLSQRVVCRPGTTYLFQFIYGVLFRQAMTAPAWQVIWLDAEGQTLQIDKALLNLGTKTDSTAPMGTTASTFYHVRVTAPPEAAQAEVRFVQPSPGGLWLEAVSFIPTVETLVNPTFLPAEFEEFDSQGRFTPTEGDELPHWQRISGWWSLEKQPAERTGSPYNLILEGEEVEDAVLSQVVDVLPEAHYVLEVSARLTEPSNADLAPLASRSRVELRWLGNGALGAPIVLFLDGTGFPSRGWAGIAPDGATQLEIRLIHPRQKGDLVIQSISLERANGLTVPLLFLSEAPGELTLSSLGVTYDLPAAPPGLNPPEEPIKLLTLTPRQSGSLNSAPTPTLSPTLISSPTESAQPLVATPTPVPTPAPTPSGRFAIPTPLLSDPPPVAEGEASISPSTPAPESPAVTPATPAPAVELDPIPTTASDPTPAPIAPFTTPAAPVSDLAPIAELPTVPPTASIPTAEPTAVPPSSIPITEVTIPTPASPPVADGTAAPPASLSTPIARFTLTPTPIAAPTFIPPQTLASAFTIAPMAMAGLPLEPLSTTGTEPSPAPEAELPPVAPLMAELPSPPSIAEAPSASTSPLVAEPTSELAPAVSPIVEQPSESSLPPIADVTPAPEPEPTSVLPSIAGPSAASAPLLVCEPPSEPAAGVPPTAEFPSDSTSPSVAETLPVPPSEPTPVPLPIAEPPSTASSIVELPSASAPPQLAGPIPDPQPSVDRAYEPPIPQPSENPLLSVSMPAAAATSFNSNSARAIAPNLASQLPNDARPEAIPPLPPPPAVVPLPANLMGALKNASEVTRDHLVRGYRLANARDYQRAIVCYNRVIELETNQPVLFAALLLRGEAWFYLKDYQSAITDYDRIVESSPNNGFGYYQRGLAHAASGNARAAIQDFQAASMLFHQQGKIYPYQQALRQMMKL